MNTPWCDQGSPDGTLFTWGVNSYVDIEIGYSNNYTQVYRIGNDPSANAMYFPSSTGYNTSSGGVSIDLEAKDWIYVEAGTNQATVIRFKYFMVQVERYISLTKRTQPITIIQKLMDT